MDLAYICNITIKTAKYDAVSDRLLTALLKILRRSKADEAAGLLREALYELSYFRLAFVESIIREGLKGGVWDELLHMIDHHAGAPDLTAYMNRTVLRAVSLLDGAGNEYVDVKLSRRLARSIPYRDVLTTLHPRRFAVALAGYPYNFDYGQFTELIAIRDRQRAEL